MLTMTCSRGCDLRDYGTVDTVETYECSAKGCGDNNLCEGCVYTCAVCSEDFCFDHVIDVNPKSDPNSLYCCLPCVGNVAAVAVTKVAEVAA